MTSQLTRQTRWIAQAYNFVGLYSIPLLTAVTIISMSNVFMQGYFSQFPVISGAWAFIFAATIDVNIVRLFLESQVEWRQGNKWTGWIAFGVGLGLATVTGVALFIEGLQQSIGLEWNDPTLKLVIAILIGLRVFLVVVLMAREGSKLGQMIAALVEEKSEQIDVIEAVNEPVIPLIEVPQIEVHPPVQTDVLTHENEAVKEAVKPASIIEQWRSTSQKTATIDEVAEALAMSKRKLLNRLNDGTLKRSPRNPNLVLLSSVFQWLSTEQNEQTPASLPAVKPTNGNGNGHQYSDFNEFVIVAQSGK